MTNCRRRPERGRHTGTGLIGRGVAACALLAAAALPAPEPATAQEPADSTRVSRPGEYAGYTEARYDDWVRRSRYIEVRDGTRLAADILRPAVDGEPVEEPLPVVWTYHRYHRADLREDGSVRTIAAQPIPRALLRHGYVVAAVDARGAGASFGTARGLFAPQEARDTYDVTEWLADRPWSDGRIGMFGGSYLGVTQLLAAGQAPPHLEAVVPEKVLFDLYRSVRPGGVLASDLMRNWSRLTRTLDTKRPAAPVQGDSGRALLERALERHRDNMNVRDLYGSLPYRDGQGAGLALPWLTGSPHTWARKARESDVAVYLMGGWFDGLARGTALWYRNLDAPRRLVMGPWFHQTRRELDVPAENLRWFDRWLKDVENGVAREDPVRYYVLGAAGGEAWRSAADWPPPSARDDTLFFAAGPGGAIESVHRGGLSPRRPEGRAAADTGRFDYTASTGKPSRWSNLYGDGGRDVSYPEMTSNDRKGFTYTTPPLERDRTLAGHPVVRLWVESTARDGDFFAYLEEVGPDGASTYLTEGVLRASNRATAAPPYDAAGLPWHRAYRRDAEPMPRGEPVLLEIPLQPVANRFEEGERIRVTVTGADTANFDAAIRPEEPPRIGIHRDSRHPSSVILPFVGGR